MEGVDIQYNSDVALSLLAEKIAQLEHDNAILRAAVTYYKGLAERPTETFATVPYSHAGPLSPDGVAKNG